MSSPSSQGANDNLGSPPPTLEHIGISEQQWRSLECMSRRFLPRFLFRGFTKSSGGGVNVDARLNSEQGIIPQGFLDGKEPTSIYDIPNLPQMLDDHLSGKTGPDVQTQFSSWAPTYQDARIFAEGMNPRIAVLDTSKMAGGSGIYNVSELVRVGLVPPDNSYSWEYLIYGPVRGEGYSCTDVIEIERDNNIPRLQYPQIQPLVNSYRPWAEYIRFKMEQCKFEGSYGPETILVLGAALLCDLGEIPAMDIAARDLCAVFTDLLEIFQLRFPSVMGSLANPYLVVTREILFPGDRYLIRFYTLLKAMEKHLMEPEERARYLYMYLY
ncbi:hypothetical protein F5Y16DRAFT_397627 [Xylariaceae sp. FL0255]|nr:hypothetical protein F5Y16DRAFT_397627 [Xylariaceae sp. FL0255]